MKKLIDMVLQPCKMSTSKQQTNEGEQTLNQLKQLQKTCGTYPIARMMQKQGYPLYMALYILTRKESNHV